MKHRQLTCEIPGLYLFTYLEHQKKSLHITKIPSPEVAIILLSSAMEVVNAGVDTSVVFMFTLTWGMISMQQLDNLSMGFQVEYLFTYLKKNPCT